MAWRRVGVIVRWRVGGTGVIVMLAMVRLLLRMVTMRHLGIQGSDSMTAFEIFFLNQQCSSFVITSLASVSSSSGRHFCSMVVWYGMVKLMNDGKRIAGGCE